MKKLISCAFQPISIGISRLSGAASGEKGWRGSTSGSITGEKLGRSMKRFGGSLAATA